MRTALGLVPADDEVQEAHERDRQRVERQNGNREPRLESFPARAEVPDQESDQQDGERLDENVHSRPCARMTTMNSPRHIVLFMVTAP